MRTQALIAAALLLLPAGEALAHARLVKADPAVGSVLARPPARIWLRFNDVIRPGASGVKLTWPDRHSALLTPLTKDPHDPEAVITPITGALPPGSYKVEWRALSPDGHRTQGDFGFTLRP